MSQVLLGAVTAAESERGRRGWGRPSTCLQAHTGPNLRTCLELPRTQDSTAGTWRFDNESPSFLNS